jgi:hybrid cluster-associated redox disulfide protein
MVSAMVGDSGGLKAVGRQPAVTYRGKPSVDILRPGVPAMLALVALLIALMLILVSGYLHWRTSVLAEDLRHVHKSWRASIEQARGRIDALEVELRELRAKVAAPAVGSAGSWFTPYMTIQDALGVHPGVKQVLAGLHIGGCSSCSVSATETLEQAAAGHGVDLTEMLARLNALMAQGPPESIPARTTAADQLPATDGGRVVIASGKVER